MGASWAYSATGSIEGSVCVKKNELVLLSEINILECCPSCFGVKDAFDHAVDNGLNLDVDYPYIPNDNSCKFDDTKRVITINGYGEIMPGDEEDLTNALATEGPVSVLVDASQFSFQLYNSGIYYDPKCSSTNLNHAMLSIGYGMHADAEYYLVKNTWGINWGEHGYIKMSRNRDNNCGIASDASYAIA